MHTVVPIWLLDKRPSSEAVHLFALLQATINEGSTRFSHQSLAEAMNRPEKVVRDTIEELVSVGAILKGDDAYSLWPFSSPPRIDHQGSRGREYGVYHHRDASGAYLYVGYTGNITKRTHDHSMNSRWWDDVANVEWFPYESAALARRAEIDDIKRLQPLHNRKHKS